MVDLQNHHVAPDGKYMMVLKNHRLSLSRITLPTQSLVRLYSTRITLKFVAYVLP